MAYFLKKSKQKNRTYLAIVESFYSPEKKGTAHRTFRSLGSVETLMKNGIEDPIAHYSREVEQLNSRRRKEMKSIGDLSPMRNLGYFAVRSVMKSLDASGYIDLFSAVNCFKFSLSELVESLVFARIVSPKSKHKTFHEVLPLLFEERSFSYDQLLEGIEFIGNNYEKFVEIFTSQLSRKYGTDTRTTLFDCTNFYFEIDREDDFRRKGPSKENRRSPIVGLGLLLDANQVPIGMKMYPGNESEKPVLREVISTLKKQNSITGRTIHVADKGLNCSANIASAVMGNDGYLFSKSVRSLPEKEKVWVLMKSDDWHEVCDSSGSTLYRYKSCVDEFPYEITDAGGRKKKVLLTEKRLLTYSPSLAKKQKGEIDRQVMKARELCTSQAKRSEFGDSAKYVRFASCGSDGKLTGDKIVAGIDVEKVEMAKRLAGYNLLVTSETDMDDRKIYDTYHTLWRIEESFRIMKSDLDARPVYLQKEDSIKGHFLICYISVLLTRILQIHILRDEYSINDIYEFIRKMWVVKTDHNYVNVTSRTAFVEAMCRKTGLPLMNYFLTEKNIKKVLNYRW